MCFCNLFNTFSNSCCQNSCTCRNNCCNNRCGQIPTNTIPRPPFIPPIIPTISNLGIYNTTSGSIASGDVVPLGTQYTSTGTNATYNPTSSVITLTNGIYRISYTASATGEVGTASLALSNNGTILPQSTSTASIDVATDIIPLTSTIIVDAQTTPVTLTLINDGTTAMTFNDVSVSVSQIR